MKKYILIVCCLALSLAGNTQNDTKYLKGAIPEIEGKIVFTKTFSLNNNISDEAFFAQMDAWTKQKYNNPDQPKERILFSNLDSKTIVCLGMPKLVFKNSAFVLDEAVLSYNLFLKVDKGICEVSIKSLKYDYPSYTMKSTPAEEVITDKEALNGQKLNKRYGKFRTHTIDVIDGLFTAIAAEIGTPNNNAPKQISVVPINGMEAQDVTSLSGYKQLTADKIPGNIIKLLNESMLITSGKQDKLNVMTASWGGIGVLWQKPIAFCFLNPTRYSIETMNEGDVYTISFYSEAHKEALSYCGTHTGKTEDKIKGSGLTPIVMPSGATAFSEAWMILECRKIVAQPISENAVIDKELASQWSKNGYHTLYIGEILNVWVK